jgi:hypothetical protein
MVSLVLPDICGYMESPDSTSKSRYVKWFNSYMAEHYTITIQNEKHCFLTGNDFYALRCAVLHQGQDNIENQKAREALKSFQFVSTESGTTIHNNRINDKLQLQVDIFCRQIIEGTEKWIHEVMNNSYVIMSRKSNMMNIQSIENGFQIG